MSWYELMSFCCSDWRQLEASSGESTTRDAVRIQVEPGKPGAEVSKRTTTSQSQRKNLPIECAQGDRPARCPNHFLCVNEPSTVPWW